jgi:hypothetical protein
MEKYYELQGGLGVICTLSMFLLQNVSVTVTLWNSWDVNPTAISSKTQVE